MRIRDWSSDVCSSDLLAAAMAEFVRRYPGVSIDLQMLDRTVNLVDERIDLAIRMSNDLDPNLIARRLTVCRSVICASPRYLREHSTPLRVEDLGRHNRSEEHTSELQSLMRSSYAVFCLKNK